MLILRPIFHKAIWGGNNFVSIYGEKAYGLAHLYSVWCKSESSNVILNGEHKGRRLYDVLKFPLTIAIVDAAHNLSIQVHPTDEAAKKIENVSIGKHEAWYFIKKPHKGYIYNGVSKDFDMNDDVLSGVQKLEIKDGDYVFVSPGTVHAITAGSFVYEIEEGSDLTYRIFDYHRTDSNGNERELHIEKAKLAIDHSVKSVTKRYSNLPIIEPTFTTCMKASVQEFQNVNDGYECVTFIGDTGFAVEGIEILTGMSIILEPNESVSFSNKHTDIIIAKVNV